MRKCSSNWRLFAFLACAATTWAGKEFPAGPGERVVPNELLIRFLPGVAPSGVLQRYTSLPFIQPLGGQDIYRVAFPNGVPPGIAAQIASDAAVIFVEPNRVRTTVLAAPNDPNYASQWALQTVQALQAWNLLPDQYLTAATASTSRLKVAILDTGADCTHPDFINTGGSSPDAASGGQLVFSQLSAPDHRVQDPRFGRTGSRRPHRQRHHVRDGRRRASDFHEPRRERILAGDAGGHQLCVAA
jgi:subtilisin family serine protease